MIQIIENYLQIEKRTTYHILRLLPLLVMLSCMSIHSGSNELENFRFFKFSSVFKFASEFTFYLSDKHHFFFLFIYVILIFRSIFSLHCQRPHEFNHPLIQQNSWWRSWLLKITWLHTLSSIIDTTRNLPLFYSYLDFPSSEWK